MSKESADNNLETMRHSASHVLAMAVLEVFPDAELGIGPAIADGFYYDFKLPVQISDKDLPKIEERMKKIIQKDLKFEKEILSKDKAVKLFKDLKQPFKVELIKELPGNDATIYKTGEFVDLCKGPHVESTGKIGAFKLTTIAGAYWKGSEKNPQLTRIYGTAFEKEKDLTSHLEKLEIAKKRDHRRIGKDMDLYSISDEIGPGLILWHPKGAYVRYLIEEFWKKEHLKRGYQLVNSPHIAREAVWKKSGHTEFFKENMFSPFGIEGDDYLIKPMNCPFHIAIYNTKLHSYKEFPIRYAELGTVYRYEKSGVLHGLTRVRGFTQDDAHIFCTEDQMEKEIINVLKLAQFMLKKFGFSKYKVFLSTRPEKFVGKIEAWDKAENALNNALKLQEIDFQIDKGEGVFYGPKIDIKMEDALGRLWQGPTIQIDFNEPEKFDVNYVGSDGKEHRAIMIHRTVLGSMERFFGTLIENTGGLFPFWLTPVQMKIITISDKNKKYAEEIIDELQKSDFRVEIDNRDENLSQKIKEAEQEKIPYIIVIGDREEKENMITVRKRSSKDLEKINLTKFIKSIKLKLEKK
jgi:threonyl-tRNA synthetase